MSNIWRIPLDEDQPVQLPDFSSDLIFDLAWSGDGKHLALLRRKWRGDVILLRDTKEEAE